MGKLRKIIFALFTHVSITDIKESGIFYVVEGTAPKRRAVQVFVLAHDYRWYLQRPVVRQGRNWSCDVVFGERSFSVAAVLTDWRGRNPIDELPQGKTAKIRVRRAF